MTRVDHVALEVADLDARLALLTGPLGMTVQRRGTLRSDPSRRVVMLGDGTGFKLELVDSADGHDRLGHVAWHVDDVVGAHDDLLAAGCAPVRPPAEFAPARSTTATVTDPGGLAVQLVRYEPDSPDR